MPVPGDARKDEGIDSAAVKISPSHKWRCDSGGQNGISYRCSQSLGEVVGNQGLGKAGVAKQYLPWKGLKRVWELSG